MGCRRGDWLFIQFFYNDIFHSALQSRTHMRPATSRPQRDLKETLQPPAVAFTPAAAAATPVPNRSRTVCPYVVVDPISRSTSISSVAKFRPVTWRAIWQTRPAAGIVMINLVVTFLNPFVRTEQDLMHPYKFQPLMFRFVIPWHSLKGRVMTKAQNPGTSPQMLPIKTKPVRTCW